MPNVPLQKRAGKNSPSQSIAYEFGAMQGFFKRMVAGPLGGPGADNKIADGGKGLVCPDNQVVFFLGGAGVGTAQLQVTVSVRRNSDGLVLNAQAPAVIGPLGPGVFQPLVVSSASLAQLHEGFSIWANVELQAGTYEGDLTAQYNLAETFASAVDPLDLTESFAEFLKAEEGHTVLTSSGSGTPLAQIVISFYNTDSVDHDYEVYRVGSLGDVLVQRSMIPAGSVNGIQVTVLNSGESMKAKILEPIVTPNRTVTILGYYFESNQRS